jgi:prophage regulatory protein
VRIVRFPELKSAYGIPYTRMHIDRLEKAKQFPMRVRLGPGCVGWVADEVANWIAERVARRSAEGEATMSMI